MPCRIVVPWNNHSGHRIRGLNITTVGHRIRGLERFFYMRDSSTVGDWASTLAILANKS